MQRQKHTRIPDAKDFLVKDSAWDDALPSACLAPPTCAISGASCIVLRLLFRPRRKLTTLSDTRNRFHPIPFGIPAGLNDEIISTIFLRSFVEYLRIRWD